ncbi:NAD-dependent epimerase/dehydratase family protein [Paenibacillus bovis]|uniref:NAD-dependent dehydratase n=1 Tax=Paenibacillus bovis TaxID=1616788 RepID=A0A172ZGC9_9BACL|nr:NAD-dependent epimerase/dehydratase family protein [Paenibacillus bovis]ANF96711.1 NAD-dependent dehydratase [Paenibacillus bovis]
MKNVLVIGGTRFFGKDLVEFLLDKGVQVTLLTRGQTEDSFGDRVQRLTADRTDVHALKQAIGSRTFDVVYDNICYQAREAIEACSVFSGHVGRYIVTSSLSVYEFGEQALLEEQVDTFHHPINSNPEAKLDYAEGKRQVEAVFFQQADFPVAAVRFPIVLGPHDYTKRLHFHVGRVQRSEVIGLSNLSARMNFIHEQEAAEFLYWLGLSSELTGPVNARSDGEITLLELITLIEQETGCKAIVRSQTEESEQSPFGVPSSWIMDTSKAYRAGFRFRELSEWLPVLISRIAAEERGDR